MAAAPMPMPFRVAFNASVYLASTAPNASWIVGPAEQTPVSTMVCTSLSARYILANIDVLIGTCNASPQGVFTCACARGWKGSYCETKMDNCGNVTCLNNGVCQSSFLSYSCQCLGESYSGRHCEIKSSSIVLLQTVSRVFGYIGILALVTVAAWVLFLDVLKYGFGVDPAREDSDKRQRKKQVKKDHTAIRFIYVNSSVKSAVGKTRV